MRFGSQEYIDDIRRMVSFLPEQEQRTAIRAAVKKIAKHSGTYSKYDGKGNLRHPFPPAGDRCDRAIYPYPMGSGPTRQGRRAKKRKWSDSKLAHVLKSRGPSRFFTKDREEIK